MNCSRTGGLLALTVCGCFAAGGCAPDLFYPTMGDVKQIAEIGRQQLDAHDDNMTRQHAVQSPESAGALEAERAVFRRQLDDLGRKTESLEASHATMVRESIALAAKVASLPEGLTQNISAALAPRIDQAREAAADVKAEVRRVETKAESAVTAAGHVEDNARKIGESLNALSASLAQRLATAGEQNDARLAALRNEVEGWRRSMIEELKLSPDELEQLKGMTTEQIIGLIAAAAGSAGLGVVSGRTGSSRAEPRLEKLETKLGAIAEEVKLRTPVPA